jgi:dipeptidyl aminopeptidase/acylaminoacyl peptidase
MRKFAYPVFICLLFVSISFAQTLTVREIMAEPSIAGMRAASEKLSPDGSKVVFLWNAEGKMPLDIYMSSTSRAAPVKILSQRDLPPPPPRTEPESKLTYGLTFRDDFVKERENAIGNLEWSPDSKKILFTQNGDLYTLYAEPQGPGIAILERIWTVYEAAMIRRADLVPNIVKTVQMSGVQEIEVFREVADARSAFLNATFVKPMGDGGARSTQQKLATIAASENLSKALERLTALRNAYPQIRGSESFSKMLDELAGTENRISVARVDYNTAGENARPKRLTKTQSAEVAARFLDNDKILFQQNGNLFVMNTSDASLVQLTREANPATFVSVVNVNPNKDGSLVAYVVSDGSKQKALFVPNYLDDFVLAPTVRRGWSDQRLMVVPTDGSRDTPFEIKLPKAEGVSSFRTVRWAADGESIVVDRNDKDTKRRQLYYVENVGGKGEKAILLTEETDEKWIAPLSALVEPNPKDAGQVVFGSEKDGYNHLYLAKLEKNKPEPNPAGEIRGENPTDPGYSPDVKIDQLTSGRWQVEWAKWMADGSQLIYSSTQDGTAEREMYSILPGSQDKRVLTVTGPGKGMKSSPQLDDSNDQPTLLYEYSKWNQPGELYAIKVCTRCRGMYTPEKITTTVPEAFMKRQWSVPGFVDIPTKDNKTVPAKIYLPANLDKTKKYPMVIFVHGAGYLQNVTDGWNNYYREFLFNELLTQKGYVVLDIDYRGSAGYGRDWRTDVYDFLGGPDMQDHLDAIDFTVKNYPVNINKIGVYGGSYGGFMAEMLAMRAPDKIAAAAALRPVADWKNYYASSPVYTAQRLGFPDKNPKGYERSSPISYADKLERPLLILHGMVDDNVHAQDSMQLIEKLIRLGKTQYFEAMLYPAENHGFTRASSWTDEYERILAFFEKHLK